MSKDSQAGGSLIFLVAGERSGDGHGARLVEAIRDRLDGTRPARFAGLGGPRLREAGGEGIEDWLADSAVLGLWEVLRHYGYFRRRFRETLGRIARERPAAVVFIDYPGFNLRLAAALAGAGDPALRIYYISPQVWAWNRGRIPRMARMLDLMLCLFPFEKSLYEASGLHAEFVGHPFVDELRPDPAAHPREPGLIGLFPGSRAREVEKHFPVLLEAGRRFVARAPGGRRLRMVASAASGALADRMRAMRDAAGFDDDACAIETGTSRELMQRAWVGAVASGTATLEAAFFGLPYCLVYKVAWPTYLAGKMVIRVPHLGIVNILAGREVVREFIQGDATPEAIAGEWEALAEPGARRDAVLADLREVVGRLGEGGSHVRAADAVIEALGWTEVNDPEIAGGSRP